MKRFRPHRHGIQSVTAMLLVTCVVTVGGAAAAAEDEQPEQPLGTVEPIDWAAFDDGLPAGDDAERLRAILLNSNRYALTTWYDAWFGDQDGEFLDFGGTGEHNIRPVAAEAFALATSLATGAYSAQATGVSEAEAVEATVRMVRSLAYRHTVNSPGGWSTTQVSSSGGGPGWQSALWAAMAAFAGWLLWDELSADDQAMVHAMIEFEANRFLDYEVPYWTGTGGEVRFPGDSKAEENSWNAMLLQVATAMLPDHPRWEAWMGKNLELMTSAFARPSDVADQTVLHGRPLAGWLDGWNMKEDGLVINHGIVHPDYMSTAVQNTHAALTSSLAGRPTPAAALHNVDVVYAALVDRTFTSPPYQPPGGTMYVRGSHEIYFPQGTSWGTSRRMDFVAMDAVARDLGLDESASLGGEYWEPLHAGRALWMQQRHSDGRTYAPEDADPYRGREEWVAMHAGWSYLTRWIVHHDAVDVSNAPVADLRLPVCNGTVAFAGTDSGVADRNVGEDCLSDRFDVERDWDGHGAFVDHVRRVSSALLADGVIDRLERAALIQAAARSTVPE